MVSSGTVNSDASSLSNYLSSYKSELSGLDGSWKGTSHDSIISKADAFVGEYTAIVSQMNSFASACDAYEKYKALKDQISQTEANRASASDDQKQSYDSALSDMRSELSRYKAQIESYLSEASSPTLTATASNAGSSGSSGKSGKSGSGGGSGSNQGIIDSIMEEVGNEISDYPGVGFHDGQWCADYVSYTLQKNGYDIEWSSLAGDGDGCIMQSIRDKGGVVHLDQGASYRGSSYTESDEYDLDYSPQAGDVVVFDFDHDGVNDHTGFVIKDNGDGTVSTIEGNTTSDSSGSCVNTQVRDRSDIYGYATPVKNGD